jgi:hypothetical protein
MSSTLSFLRLQATSFLEIEIILCEKTWNTMPVIKSPAWSLHEPILKSLKLILLHGELTKTRTLEPLANLPP